MWLLAAAPFLFLGGMASVMGMGALIYGTLHAERNADWPRTMMVAASSTLSGGCLLYIGVRMVS